MAKEQTPTPTPIKLHDHIGSYQAVERAVLQVYNAELTESDTRAVLQMLGERISELLSRPDAGKRTRGSYIKPTTATPEEA